MLAAAVAAAAAKERTTAGRNTQSINLSISERVFPTLVFSLLFLLSSTQSPRKQLNFYWFTFYADTRCGIQQTERIGASVISYLLQLNTFWLLLISTASLSCYYHHFFGPSQLYLFGFCFHWTPPARRKSDSILALPVAVAGSNQVLIRNNKLRTDFSAAFYGVVQGSFTVEKKRKKINGLLLGGPKLTLNITEI